MLILSVFSKGVESNEGSSTERYQDHLSCSFCYKVICVDEKFTKPIAVYRGENAAYKFIGGFFEEFDYYNEWK